MLRSFLFDIDSNRSQIIRGNYSRRISQDMIVEGSAVAEYWSTCYVVGVLWLCYSFSRKWFSTAALCTFYFPDCWSWRGGNPTLAFRYQHSFDDAGLSLYPYSSVLSATPILTQLHTARHPFVADVPRRTGIRPKSHSKDTDVPHLL